MDKRKISISFDGNEMKTKEQLLSSMKEALSFPDYFGMNWDSLDEALKDLSWLDEVESIHIAFDNPKAILSSEAEKDHVIFTEIIDSTIEYWKTMEEGLDFSVEFPMGE